MFKIKTFDNIAQEGLEILKQKSYDVSKNEQDPDAIMLRSTKLHDYSFERNLLAVGRAGAGVNNIPVEKLTVMGVPVFNAPGANANAVKELVLAGMLLAARNICTAWSFTQSLKDHAAFSESVESGKKQFAGYELPTRTLGVIGLGAIGVKVANAALDLGMRVIGFDPTLTVKSAWQLSSQVEATATLDSLLQQADMITLHVPLIAATEHLIDEKKLALVKNGAVLLNFARGPIVDEVAVLKALDGALGCYVTDFPSKALLQHPKVIALPHLGASTEEAEVNCATMVATELRRYLEDGEIINAVNFPEVKFPRQQEGTRLSIVNQNIPNMVGQISTVLAESNLNIIDMVNKSKGEVAYTLLDVEGKISTDCLGKLSGIKGVIKVRVV